MSVLPTPLRRQLETAIKRARKIAEGGAHKALEALAVHEPDAYEHMDEAQCDLRRKLLAQAKQLGDRESQTRCGAYDIGHLVEKLAYDQWHRLLFARFLLENNLLISPEHGVSVTLDDCEELAAGLALRDAWAVAARFAADELPEIFRADDPTGAVGLPVEDRNQLIQFVMDLPVEVYTASDSLGWCYQFWQAERKQEINEAGVKIGADELPAVTQLFTEDYMVDFLLDNTLGAWHAGKVLAQNTVMAETAATEEEVRNAVALPGCQWTYLRFIQAQNGKWAPAGGTFNGWPKHAKELRCLDPGMGSGHFVVAMFERLVALRIAEEELDDAATTAAVIRDNLFGLELDPRCTQIAVFNLALAGWRRIGHCQLPPMNLACSGLAPHAREGEWLTIAGDDEKLRNGMQRLYRLFKEAPILGSLINPRAMEGDLLEAAFHELQPLLEKVLSKEIVDDDAHEMTVTARGLAKAAEILAGQFTLVATNVPYLGRGKQDEVLQNYSKRVYPEAKADLATCFVQRCLEFCASGGSTGLVTPQNWLFMGTYAKLRSELLEKSQWQFIGRLGPKAFQTPMWDFNIVLVCITRRAPTTSSQLFGLDVGGELTPIDKQAALISHRIATLDQRDQQKNPDCRILLNQLVGGKLFSASIDPFIGFQNGDSPRFLIHFWEVDDRAEIWEWLQSTTNMTTPFNGYDSLLRWEDGRGAVTEIGLVKGREAWGKRGVCVRLMGDLPCSLYYGHFYDQSSAVIIPKNQDELEPVWSYCSSTDFHEAVREVDQALKVTNATLGKIPFDLAHWQKVAAERYPHGLPKPHSSDPTQWLYDGHPKGSDQALHVAVGRLLGYQWPRQTGSSFPECPPLGPDGLEGMADEDGVVCLSATKGEEPAAERLRRLLVQALGDTDLGALIGSAGPKGSKSSTLEDWLRDEFFDQHCALFEQRPFIWHIWDGHKSGFSALLNYHKLTHANLENLTYAYLGDWIRRQQAAVDAGEAGSDARLQAAKQLQARLKLILEGEPPFDIFVRWKSLSKQAIGWHPDLNDGVRMNIRPFLVQDIPGGKRGAGILRARPTIRWEKDRGSEPPRDKDEFPWFWGWDGETQNFAGVGRQPDGNRWNDCHYSNDFKKKARERASCNG